MDVMFDFVWKQYRSVANIWALQTDVRLTGFRLYPCTNCTTLNFIAPFLICIKELCKMTSMEAVS